MDILILFALFQAKHYVADFYIQTYQQTIRKGIYRDPIGISHSFDHMLGTMIVFFIFCFFYPLPFLKILLVTFLEGIAHYHIDWVKVKYGSKDTTKPIFWNQFGLDQFAHQITYILMIWYLLLI